MERLLKEVTTNMLTIIIWTLVILLTIAVIGSAITLSYNFKFADFIVWLAMCVILAIFVMILKDGSITLK